MRRVTRSRLRYSIVISVHAIGLRLYATSDFTFLAFLFYDDSALDSHRRSRRDLPRSVPTAISIIASPRGYDLLLTVTRDEAIALTVSNIFEKVGYFIADRTKIAKLTFASVKAYLTRKLHRYQQSPVRSRRLLASMQFPLDKYSQKLAQTCLIRLSVRHFYFSQIFPSTPQRYSRRLCNHYQAVIIVVSSCMRTQTLELFGATMSLVSRRHFRLHT